MTKDEAAALKAKHGTIAAASRASGVPASTISDALARKTDKAKPEPQARTLADFRREHDQTWKILDGLRRLFSGGVIMTDAEFREAVGGNPSRWRAAADLGEFKQYRYRVAGELLWASETTIREMRAIRGEAV